MANPGQTVNHREVIAAVSTVTHTPEYLTSTNGALNVNGSGGGGGLPTAPLYNQVTTTGSAVQFPSNALTVGVIVQALSTNTASVYIGDASVSSSNGYELQPGQATSAAISNTNELYITGTSGDKICFIGS